MSVNREQFSSRPIHSQRALQRFADNTLPDIPQLEIMSGHYRYHGMGGPKRYVDGDGILQIGTEGEQDCSVLIMRHLETRDDTFVHMENESKDWLDVLAQSRRQGPRRAVLFYGEDQVVIPESIADLNLTYRRFGTLALCLIRVNVPQRHWGLVFDRNTAQAKVITGSRLPLIKTYQLF